jgi:hypothetical protein
MTHAQSITHAKFIAEQINGQIQDMQNNGEWFNAYELTKDYFNAFDINDDMLFMQVLNIVE